MPEKLGPTVEQINSRANLKPAVGRMLDTALSRVTTAATHKEGLGQGHVTLQGKDKMYKVEVHGITHEQTLEPDALVVIVGLPREGRGHGRVERIHLYPTPNNLMLANLQKNYGADGLDAITETLSTAEPIPEEKYDDHLQTFNF